MPRKESPSVEILSAKPQAELEPRPAKLQEYLDQLIEERIAEALSRRASVGLEMEFLPRRAANELRRHQTVFDRRRWSLYFDRWGCRGCHRKKVSHVGAGYCSRCHLRIARRLEAIACELAEQHAAKNPSREIERIGSRSRDAQRLLNGGEE